MEQAYSPDDSLSSADSVFLISSTYWKIQGAADFVWGVRLALPSFADGELFTRLKNTATVEPKSSLGARIQSPLALPSPGYYAMIGPGYAVSIRVDDLYIVKDGTTRLGTYYLSKYDAKVRFRLNGTSLWARAWGPSDPEPTSWHLQVTDDTYTSGYIGLGRGDNSGGAGYIYPIGIDYGGFNAPTSGNLKTISGQVTLNGNPVQGATVIAVRDGYDFSNPGIPGIDFAKATTDDNGNYTLSLDVDSGNRWFIQAKYYSGGTWYTGVIDANEGDSGVNIGLRPGRVLRARYKGTWYSTIYEKQGGIWVPR
jgi:hypothetical protein